MLKFLHLRFLSGIPAFCILFILHSVLAEHSVIRPAQRFEIWQTDFRHGCVADPRFGT